MMNSEYKIDEKIDFLIQALEEIKNDKAVVCKLVNKVADLAVINNQYSCIGSIEKCQAAVTSMEKISRLINCQQVANRESYKNILYCYDKIAQIVAGFEEFME